MTNERLLKWYGKPLPAVGTERITSSYLFNLMASKISMPLFNNRFDFVFKTVPYEHYLRNGSKKINVKASPNQVKERIGLICDVLTGLTSRTDDGKPVFSLEDTYNAFSLIASNWISIHGCLGADGHGRAGALLLPITLSLAGHSNKFKSDGFFDADGQVNMNIAMPRIIFHDDLKPRFSGIRLFAALLELDRTGEVSEVLLNRSIIGNSESRNEANKHAIKTILKKN